MAASRPKCPMGAPENSLSLTQASTLPPGARLAPPCPAQQVPLGNGRARAHPCQSQPASRLVHLSTGVVPGGVQVLPSSPGESTCSQAGEPESEPEGEGASREGCGGGGFADARQFQGLDGRVPAVRQGRRLESEQGQVQSSRVKSR